LREIPKRILSVFGEERTHIVSFETAAKAGICDAFLALMDGPTLAELGHSEIRANEGLSGPATHVNYLMNKIYPAGHPARSKRVMYKIRRVEGSKYKAPPLTSEELDSYRALYEENQSDLKLDIEHPDALPTSDTPEEAMIPLSALEDILTDYAQSVRQLNKVRKTIRKALREKTPLEKIVKKIEPPV